MYIRIQNRVAQHYTFFISIHLLVHVHIYVHIEDAICDIMD